MTHTTTDMDQFVLTAKNGSNSNLNKAIKIIYDAFKPVITGCIRKYPTFDKSLLENVSREAIWQSIMKFDSEKGSFSNYLSKNIKFAIANEVSGDIGIVHIPDEVRSNIRKVDKVVEEFENKGLKVTVEDISDATGLELKAVEWAINVSSTVQNVVSLDSPLSEAEEDSLCLGDTIAVSDPETEMYSFPEVMKDLKKALGTLPDKERTVYMMKMGIKGKAAKNREIMEALGVSEPTVISLFKKAERKIRSYILPLHIAS